MRPPQNVATEGLRFRLVDAKGQARVPHLLCALHTRTHNAHTANPSARMCAPLHRPPHAHASPRASA
jgi:hypothetical protein